MDEEYAFGKIMSGKFIFLKFWYFPNMDLYYGVSALPGVKEGISGSSLGGFNIGINKYIPEAKKEASIQALVYMTSKNVQKNITMNNLLYTGIPSLYDEEDVCNAVNCKFFKSIQLTPRPRVPNYTEYSDSYRSYIFDFLYGNSSVEDALMNVNDITKLYYISLDTKDTSAGLVIFVICTVLSVIMLSLLLMLKSKNRKSYYEFLPNDFWILVVLGSVIFLYTCFLDIGKPNSFKCHLKPFFLSVGFTLVLTPVLYKLIVNFPDPNKITEWIDNHRYIFILIFISIDILLFLMTFITPYKIEDVRIKDGKNFQICFLKNKLGDYITILIEIYKFIMVLVILIMIFLEWCIEKTYYDVRFIVLAIYMDALSAIALFIYHFSKINNYILKFVLPSTIFIFFAITNFTFIYGFRIIFSVLITKNEEDLFLKKFREEALKMNNSTNPSHSSNHGSTSNLSSSASVRITNKILNYHYQKSSIKSNGSRSFSESSSSDLQQSGSNINMIA